MRTVHFFDAAGAGWVAGEALRSTIAECTAECDHRVVLVGGREDASHARTMGVDWHDHLTAPTGRAWLAWRKARSLLRSTPEVGRVCAWSSRTAKLARWASPGAPVIVEVASTARRSPPSSTGRTRDRASMLARWRLHPSSSIVGFLADGRRAIRCTDASFLLGVLTLAGQPAVGVMWRGSARSVERGERMIYLQHRRWRLIIEDEPPPCWVGACDVCVVPGSSGPSPAAVDLACARRVPIVVEIPGDPSKVGPEPRASVRTVRGGVRHACAGAALDVLEHLPRGH